MILRQPFYGNVILRFYAADFTVMPFYDFTVMPFYGLKSDFTVSILRFYDNRFTIQKQILRFYGGNKHEKNY